MTDHFLALELEVVLRVQHLVHVRADEKRILNGPRPRRIAQELEFDGQVLAASLDECIYPARVGFEQLPVLRIQRGRTSHACFANLQVTLATVMEKQPWTEN